MCLREGMCVCVRKYACACEGAVAYRPAKENTILTLPIELASLRDHCFHQQILLALVVSSCLKLRSNNRRNFKPSQVKSNHVELVLEGTSSILETVREAAIIWCQGISRWAHKKYSLSVCIGFRTEPIWAPSQLSVCSHTPTVHSTTISRFPYNLFLMWRGYRDYILATV